MHSHTALFGKGQPFLSQGESVVKFPVLEELSPACLSCDGLAVALL